MFRLLATEIEVEKIAKDLLVLLHVLILAFNIEIAVNLS